MAKYRGPVCKLCRREGEKLFLKGTRCYTPKCAFEKRGYPPGMHGKGAQFRRKRESDFARQLRAKQKARRVYGVLERQFHRFGKGHGFRFGSECPSYNGGREKQGQHEGSAGPDKHFGYLS